MPDLYAVKLKNCLTIAGNFSTAQNLRYLRLSEHKASKMRKSENELQDRVKC